MPCPAFLAKLSGSLPALPTPFLRGDPAALDGPALERLAARALAHGAAGLVVCGSTGEAPALHREEHAEAIRIVAAVARGRAPVIAGIGAPNTEAAVALAVAAERCGASGLLVSAPPYVKPTQEGLRCHVRAVAAATGLPVVLYDVPSRAGVGFADETIARLCAEGMVQALKDATGDLARPARLRRLCGADFPQLSGDDPTQLAHRAMGGVGCISVTAALVPGLCTAQHAAWDVGDLAHATRLRDRLAPLHEALFAETNPIPLKAALGLLGLADPTPRLPLTRATKETLQALSRLLPGLTAEENEAAALLRVA
ncbi:4-hydroxy-tetrahydrodipicolinate synthase [Siccirubricoccus sp. KC 17139]|uniref:4-hydroxy-tetrahydrodipicolinate synthase n=1 Tax=Siccirubricoccus soli TaxID=2899147 RepID=A0ABT1DEQ7_9PROT|nr:4-hydroxy-tetrahydrodipicolinate synthase [Siccirubricoccus soli]MCO6419699.1 4-hydroxy-tetrahydrodipicolinate synthase [Siccirubricoccus soli]MCP2685834.1 4-hydroxy-tetrahydrodipicolinate synthase [Siccirubricoccus soli]